jgi:UDP-N-acetylmuramoylalanine--D-glutamate ligase
MAESKPYETDLIPESHLLGEHNKDNIRAAITVCRLFDITDNEVKVAVASFKPLPHRLELVGTFNGITFYDDAISTTPESTMAALQSIPNVKTLFLGGENRGYNFVELVQMLKHQQITNIVLFPNSGDAIKEEIKKDSEYKPKILETNDMEKAVQFAYAHTPEQSVCLLSTASPSYSVWKNFEEKGNMFKTFVTQYAYEKKNS